METITIHPRSKEETKAFEQMAKVLKVPYEKVTSKNKKSSYNPSLVAKIKKGDKDRNAGKFKSIKIADLWK
jgi:hypothetical protein